MELDKVIHSAVGTGAIITAIIGLILWFFGIAYLIVLVPALLALAKEVKDKINYGKFDLEDFKATLNPLIVWRWYQKQMGK